MQKQITLDINSDMLTKDLKHFGETNHDTKVVDDINNLMQLTSDVLLKLRFFDYELQDINTLSSQDMRQAISIGFKEIQNVIDNYKEVGADYNDIEYPLIVALEQIGDEKFKTSTWHDITVEQVFDNVEKENTILMTAIIGNTSKVVYQK